MKLTDMILAREERLFVLLQQHVSEGCAGIIVVQEPGRRGATSLSSGCQQDDWVMFGDLGPKCSGTGWQESIKAELGWMGLNPGSPFTRDVTLGRLPNFSEFSDSSSIKCEQL